MHALAVHSTAHAVVSYAQHAFLPIRHAHVMSSALAAQGPHKDSYSHSFSSNTPRSGHTSISVVMATVVPGGGLCCSLICVLGIQRA
jgi:hypothetical protein